MWTIDEVMTREIRTLRSDDTVDRLQDLMHIHHISCVPIVEDGALRGIVTSTDVVENWPPDQRLDSIMSDAVLVVAPDTKLTDAARLMREHGIHHLVVGQSGSIEGVVSSWDLLDVLADIVDSGDIPFDGCER